jgi:hypothetical protein
MADYMIPTNEQFIEHVAKAIAKNRILQEAKGSVGCIIDKVPDVMEQLEDILDQTFDEMWKSGSASEQRQIYRDDARAVISAINMKLLTMPE